MDVLHNLGLPAPSHRWWERAACRGHNTDLFFPSRGTSGETARQVCARCPVADECLAAALLEETSVPRDHRHGYRGGFTGPERAILAA